VLGDNKIASQTNAFSNAARLLKKLQLHYLEVPLAASYQVTPRFSVRAGMNAAILLNSSSDYTTGGVFSKELNPAGLLQDEAEASFDYNGEQPSVELNHFDLSATTGFDYRINTRLSAGLGYQFGMVDLPGNDAGDFNRLLRLTLRYNFTLRK
jgi:long-subunit fatty acid transport protein